MTQLTFNKELGGVGQQFKLLPSR
ncbi:hypothetical protein [Erwinia sp. JUb26]